MIPKLTKEQELESFESERLSWVEGNRIVFTKRNLAKLCLQEIDHAIGLINSVDIKDVEEQFEDQQDYFPPTRLRARRFRMSKRKTIHLNS